ncbi:MULTISPECIES: NPP1 family protein [Streptomyces]|uniref:NPP1 family protein n=1 Tax=Streptomyces caniscabiei TaxID=2746961 RepID=A0ABU4MDQ8_9ACTN|nr:MULTISPECIES: NPP1 family protein [Streptomyces]MBE4740626.1 NPP1 family protein [Streptomyces caniscabiei]MBE4759476.1 NPP1 family protein [Streptomyces caniscabiei]MBE4774568.1 NPP1 family protein [Streptomyces caniscabiei]MBE4788758.1 NPP1 family protein [Streptomyces caniscabiei]MBE4798119.1 NPP1 family protein [Streptomyces caniscabiei]
MSQALKSRKSRLGRLGRFALVAASAAALTIGLTSSAHAGVLTPLPESTTTFQKTFQPVFDYDTDSCLPVAAIDQWGNLNGGLDDSGPITGQCRDNHLGRANVYSRAKCNNGWCAIVYTEYFEKDMSCAGCTSTSHRHDWEAAVIWIRQGASTPSYASVSAHGNYTTKNWSDVPRDGVRLKVVYHKEGQVLDWGTHAFRFAGWGETAEAWGDGGWDFPPLVTWNRFPAGNNGVNLQSRMQNATWGDANFPLKDGRYNNELNAAKNGPAAGIPFDVWAAG